MSERRQDTAAATPAARPTAPRWRTDALTLAVSVAVHAAIFVVLASIVYAVIEEPQTEAVVTLTTIDPTEAVPLPQTGTTGGGAPSVTPPQDVAHSEAVAAPLPAPPLPAAVGAPATASDAALSMDPAVTDPALAILAELADAPATTTAVGAGHNPLLRGVDAGTLDGLGRIGRQGLDVVFVLDATGSMDNSIRQAKRRVLDIHAVVTGMLGGGDADAGQTSVRFGVVAFKDYGDDYGLRAVKPFPLSPDPEALRTFVTQVFVGGGGVDLAEPIDRALAAATDADDMGWQKGRHNVIVLVTDAPVHSSGRRRALNSAKRFADRLGGTINVIDTDPDRDHVLADLGEIALAGNGSAFRLEDSDGFWKHLIVSIFPKRFEHDVTLIVERYAQGS